MSTPRRMMQAVQWDGSDYPDCLSITQVEVRSHHRAGHWTSHWTGRLYAFEYPELTLSFAPDVFVDISEQVERKRQSLRCFQVHIDSNFKGDLETYESSFLGTNRYWGLESGALYAEAYKQVKIHEVHTKAVKHLL